MDLRVNLGPRTYDIAVVNGDASGLGPFARQRCPAARAFVVADENVQTHAESAARALHAAGFAPTLVIVSPGEASKCLAVVGRLYDALAILPADRQTPVVAVGGGVVGDMAGFAAATYNRGLPLLMVPTSLLAMVDSSVGGKVGINLSAGKNLVGAFHQPAGVWIDIAVLGTLPQREFDSGLAEVVKYGVILDADFFAWLESNAEAILARDADAVREVIMRCCRLKADVVELDEREETGLRVMLNYGHTFAHAFETVGGYGDWLHGEAVAAGMICASRLAERLGMIGPDVTNRQMRLLKRLGLPASPNPRWPAEALLDAMRRDKKTQSGRLRFVLPVRLGAVKTVDGVDETAVRAVLGS